MEMKRVLGYLKYTQNYALHYNNYPAVIEGYSDANRITWSIEVKSTSACVFILGVIAVSWKYPNRHILLAPQWNLNHSFG